jgi:hypothetical protein
MARHHIRDEKGDLHIYNDEEYKQYKYNKGCLGVFALLVFIIGGILSKCSGDKDTTSSSKIEEFVNSEVPNPTEKSDNTTDMNMLMNEQSQIEELEEVETQRSIEEVEDNSTIQKEVMEESPSKEISNDKSYSENNNESFTEDQKLLKKQQKEERKRQKKLEKEAKRIAKEEAKEAKRRAKEETKE